MSQTCDQLKEYLKEIDHYRRVITLMEWDMYTATPPKGYDRMADTLTWFSTKEFVLSTAPELLEMLEKLSIPEEYDRLDEGMQYTVRTMLRDLKRQQRIPKDFFEEFTALQSRSQNAWREAKQSSDYSKFAPYLEKLICKTKEKYAFTDPDMDCYEAMLNDYEEGMDMAGIDRVFSELKEGLLPLLDEILAKRHTPSRIYEGTYDPDAQRKVQRLLLEYIGFSFDAGCCAETEHPFSLSFNRSDVRVTNHFREHDPIGPMFSAIHEGGHAIFSQNVSEKLMDTAADDCCYMGVHESQSRFFENILGRRKSFWEPIYSSVQDLLPDLKKIPLDEFVNEINYVHPSMIRTEADEVTYCLHVILRYEMEKEIFHGDLPVDDLPRLWNRKMQDYLHLTPSNDAEGILQDMHWSDGSFGYFPSYLLGSIYDGMFLEQMCSDLGDIDQLLSSGQILTATHWLNEKIHQYGALRKPKEILQQVCHKPLSAQPLLNYFRQKYL